MVAMGSIPEERLAKQTNDKKYVGRFISYEGSELGYADIQEYPTGKKGALGKIVKSWVGVSREEG
jgi:hypothetical protein